MKKYFFKDEDEEIVEVTELDEEPIEEVVNTDAAEETAMPLTAEETELLKKLLPYVDKIVEMFAEKPAETVDACGEKVEDEDVDEDVEEAMKDEDETEEDKTSMTHDSKKSFGSIETKKTKTTDSVDRQEAIAEAFRKRYGG